MWDWSSYELWRGALYSCRREEPPTAVSDKDVVGTNEVNRRRVGVSYPLRHRHLNGQDL